MKKIVYYTKILKALSDPSRLKLLKLLSEKELCVCEIEEIMNIKQTTVSQQLRRLKEADLVNERKDGWWTYYCLKKETIQEFITSFKEFMEMDLKNVSELKEHYKRFSRLSKNQKIINCKKKH